MPERASSKGAMGTVVEVGRTETRGDKRGNLVPLVHCGDGVWGKGASMIDTSSTAGKTQR